MTLIHTWVKFCKDILKTVTCIEEVTDRQTDKQTDKQTVRRTYLPKLKIWQVMKGQSEIAYLPKFANIMLIVMVIVINEIFWIILMFDCFENQ